MKFVGMQNREFKKFVPDATESVGGQVVRNKSLLIRDFPISADSALFSPKGQI